MQLSRKIFTLNKYEKNLLALFIKEAEAARGTNSHNFSAKNPIDFSNAPFGSTQLLGAYLSELLIKLIRGLNEPNKFDKGSRSTESFTTNQFTELITEYMKKNVFSNLSLVDICNQFIIGKSKLSVIFKEHTGMCPMQYYNNLKINKAKQLIREGNLSISEISDKLGYSSIHIFSRAFKQRVGFSPIAYKKSIL